MMPLIEGGVIRFSDFSTKDDITYFYNVIPDTVWIKQKPKKNPIEGKHYVLRKLYHSEFVQSRYGITIECTPAIEFVGVQFIVTKLEELSSYTADKRYRVYMRNIATGEDVYWNTPLPGSNLNFKIHIQNFDNRLGIVGDTIYSAKYEIKSFTYTNYTNIEQYLCSNAEGVIDLTNYTPGFYLELTIVGKDDYTTQIKIPFKKEIFSGTAWFAKDQVPGFVDAYETYKIDYTVNLNALTNNFPFSFFYIMGTPTERNSAQVGQILAPLSYTFGTSMRQDGYIKNGDLFFIGDLITVRGEDYYKAALEGKAFYIPVKHVKLTQEEQVKLDSLMNCSQDIRDSFFETAKAFSFTDYSNYLDKAFEEINRHAVQGLSITDLDVYDMSEYTDGTGIRFKFYNPTKKTIKYVNLTFVGYNAVDDRVGSSISKRCIGPIEPEETAMYNFDYVWFTDIVKYAKITSISVQYRDGSIKKISNPRSIMLSAETIKILYTSSLSDLKSELIETKE